MKWVQVLVTQINLANMSTITTILSTDRATDSRAVINTNFANLNADKKEVGYVIQATHSPLSPSDSTTYYFGSQTGITPSTTAATARVYIPKAGTIKTIYAYVSVLGTLGTSETSTLSLRLNNSTDTTITSSLVTTAVSQVFSATVSIAVVAGDYFEIKWVTPAWATNPTTVRIPITVYIE